MSKKPRKRRIKKGRIKLKSGAKVVRKDSVRNDAIKKAPTKTILPTNGITFKVKVRKK